MVPKKLKEVREILGAPGRHWVGNGFHVYPVFHNRAFTKELSPWLMFDYAAPKEFKPGYERRGVGQHPHRGFETITIAFQGEVEHGDSVGNRDVIGPGDVQWMTAARGIIHEEFHSTNFQQTGGTFEMAQLWLNLPKKHKVRRGGGGLRGGKTSIPFPRLVVALTFHVALFFPKRDTVFYTVVIIIIIFQVRVRVICTTSTGSHAQTIVCF